MYHISLSTFTSASPHFILTSFFALATTYLHPVELPSEWTHELGDHLDRLLERTYCNIMDPFSAPGVPGSSHQPPPYQPPGYFSGNNVPPVVSPQIPPNYQQSIGIRPPPAVDIRPQENDPLDAELTCKICKNFYDCPTIIGFCGHIFCMQCLRNMNKRVLTCPICQKTYTLGREGVDKLKVDEEMAVRVLSRKAALVEKVSSRMKSDCQHPGNCFHSQSPFPNNLFFEEIF